ncbi:MAG: ArsB/NhaD family transporter [Pseudomonadota bacterium]
MDAAAVLYPIVWGIDARWFVGTVFVATYLLIMSERVNRVVVATIAGGLMVLGGVLDQQSAVQGVDFNTIGLLIGMMIIVGVVKQSGVFQYLAVGSAKLVRANPWGILVMLTLVTAVLSAFLNNVTTVLLIVPVTLLITDALKISAYPYLFAEIFATNIGGTATLIGDPPNIMISSAIGFTFNQFLSNLGPIAVILLALTLIPIMLIWKRDMQTTPERRQRIMAYVEREAITDRYLLWMSVSVLLCVILGFVISAHIHRQPATIALFGAAVMLLLYTLNSPSSEQSRRITAVLADIEWTTIFFFIGLFILVYGVESTGLLEVLARQAVKLTAGDTTATAMAVLWISAVTSAMVDNIPFVAAMIPLLQKMGTLADGNAMNAIWWSLALGSCLGGSGTLVGASSNLIIAGFAESSGQPIRFLRFMLLAFPLMLGSIAVSTVYVYLRYL